MDIYLINLKKRPDRLALMDRQLGDLNLAYTRIEAVDGTGDDNIGYNPDDTAMGKAEFACYKSHLLVFQALVQSDEDCCLVLEDDLALSKNFGKTLANAAFFTNSNAIVRLEIPFQTVHQKPVRLGNTAKIKTACCNMHHLISPTFCLGAYVISRDLAQRILTVFDQPQVPIDRLLLQNKSIVSPAPEIYQITPPQAIQTRFLTRMSGDSSADSDLEVVRADRLHTAPETLVTNVMLQIFQKGLKNIRRNLNRIWQQTSRLFLNYQVLEFDDD